MNKILFRQNKTKILNRTETKMLINRDTEKTNVYKQVFLKLYLVFALNIQYLLL